VLSPSDVSAVIVTKGDVDLAPIRDSLVFRDVHVYDNSQEPDKMTYGRVVAAHRAANTVVYSQDDDIIHSPQNQMRILSEYQAGKLVGCMWEEWSAGAKKQGIEDGYDDIVFPGSGSISDVSVWDQALEKYLSRWEEDDFFHLWSDTIIGVISPTVQLDLRFQVLPCAGDESRMCNLPDAVAKKAEAIRRARETR
jgi:hypothetical protein